MVKRNGFGFIIFFISFLLLMLVINFTGSYFGITHLYWHLFLHIGIIALSFLILIYSLKLNEKAMKYIIFGSMLWILTNCILFLSHIFEEYMFLQTNLFTFLGVVFGALFIMKGFREAVNG